MNGSCYSLLNQLKRLGADSLLYAFMNVGTKLIAFIMLPIYTHYFSKAEFGVLDIWDRVTSMLTFLVIFGTDSALSFYYFDTKDDKKRLEHVRNVMYFRLAVVAVLFIPVALFGSQLSNLFFDNSAYASLLFLGMAVLLLDTLVVVVLMVMRFEFATLKVVILTVLKMLMIAVFSYVILRYFNRSPNGVLMGRTISGAIILGYLLITGRKYFVPKINWSSMKELLIYAAPLAPASVAFWVIASSSSFFIKHFGSLGDAGIYGAATRLATVITLLTSGVQMAWRPYSMSIKDKKDSPELFSKIFYVLLLVGVFGVMAVATVMPWVIKILGPEYYEAYKYVSFVSAATFLNFFYMIISVGLFFKKKTNIISYTFGIVALVNLILNFLLIPTFGVWGAVISYLLSYLSAITLIFKKSQQYYFVPVSYLKMSVEFLVMLLCTVGIVYIQEMKLNFLLMIIPWAVLFAVTALLRFDRVFRKK
jgi:O-antigen/teichoic acid export membrane protein